jgi:hypothetical protein
MLSDQATKIISELVALRDALQVIEDSHNTCDCTSVSSPCPLCRADAAVKQYMVVGLQWELRELERDIDLTHSYRTGRLGLTEDEIERMR